MTTIIAVDVETTGTVPGDHRHRTSLTFQVGPFSFVIHRERLVMGVAA